LGGNKGFVKGSFEVAKGDGKKRGYRKERTNPRQPSADTPFEKGAVASQSAKRASEGARPYNAIRIINVLLIFKMRSISPSALPTGNLLLRSPEATGGVANCLPLADNLTGWFSERETKANPKLRLFGTGQISSAFSG
jgi:hypothetical protein